MRHPEITENQIDGPSFPEIVRIALETRIFKDPYQNRPKPMKFRSWIIAVAVLGAGNAFAASGVFESYGILKINASTNVYYDMQATTGNPDLQGASLGTFDVSIGNTLTLVGGELKTFKNGLSDVFGAKYDYRVYKVGDTAPSFSEFDLGFNSNLGVGGDQKWDNTGANVNLLTGLSNGNYILEAFSYANTSDGTSYSNNGGGNYTATFSVVPEPASAVLGLLGMTMLLRRRK